MLWLLSKKYGYSKLYEFMNVEGQEQRGWKEEGIKRLHPAHPLKEPTDITNLT